MESGACPGPGSIERFLTSKSKSCSMLGSTILIAFIYTAGIHFCVSAAALLGNRNNKVFMCVNSILFAGSWVMWGSYMYLLARFGLLSECRLRRRLHQDGPHPRLVRDGTTRTRWSAKSSRRAKSTSSTSRSIHCSTSCKSSDASSDSSKKLGRRRGSDTHWAGFII